MPNTPLIAGGVLLAAAGALAAFSDRSDPVSWEGRRVLLLGDSHLGSPAFRHTVTQALTARGAQVVGVLQNNGWSEQRYLDSGLLRSLPGRPDAAVVALGGNNMTMNPDAYAAILRSLVGVLRDQGVSKILWASPATSNASIAPSTASRHMTSARIQKDVLPGLGVTWWDSRPVTRSGQRDDGVHFTEAGYRKWAQSLMA